MQITDNMTVKEVQELTKQDMYNVRMDSNCTYITIKKVNDITFNCKGSKMKIMGTHTHESLYDSQEMQQIVKAYIKKLVKAK